MKCPKCSFDINDEMLVCPNCKKVLKLVCPKCNTINKTNLCKKCGFVIISKCHKCGKINQTVDGACSKCGFSTYTSVAINSSNIDEFACLTIEFPNLNSIKSALGSTKLTEKFKANLDKLILDYTNSTGITREIIDDVYVIRFNKSETFAASAKSALKAAIEIQNLITKLNFKLNKLKNTLLHCNIAILKRDIYSKPNQYKSGFDIKLIYTNQFELQIINSLQIITDSYIYEKVCNDFDLSALTAKFVKNEMMTFFELNLKKYIKIPKNDDDVAEESDSSIKLNALDDNLLELYEDKNELNEQSSISFNELKCKFTKVKSVNLIPEILNKLQKDKKRIISVKSEKEFLPQTENLLNGLEYSLLFKNIFRVTCHDEMKYKPYGFFQELISSIYNFSVSPKNFAKHNFELFKDIDSSNFIKDLMNLTKRSFPHPEDARYSLFDIFFEMFRSMSNCLIYIENFEKIDDTSYEVLQLFFEKFNELGVSYLILTDKEHLLHKKSHFLLANPNYVEISTIPTPFKEIIGDNIKKYDKILDSYYFTKIAQNTRGSVLYFNNAIQYLIEKDVLTYDKKEFILTSSENIFIPQNLDELIQKRLKHLSKDKELYNFFGMLLFIGSMVDLATVNLFGIDTSKIIQKLIKKNYIYTHNNAIYIQNYNLYRDNFIISTPIELKQVLASELLSKVFSSEIKHPCETVLYKILEQEKQEFIVWEKLSELNASLGDFSAYLNCSVKFLKLLDNHVNESSQKTIEDYKMEVYENISNLLYKYTPNEIYNIVQNILTNLEKSTDDKKVIELYNKMLQGCFIGGNYSYALDLIYKMLSRFPNASINPQDSKFNKAFFLLSLVKIEIMFSIGDLKNCVESGEEILDVITLENLSELKPENLSAKQFENSILEAMSFAAISKIILLQDDLKDFILKLQTNMKEVPKVFSLFLILEKLIKGENVQFPDNISVEEDKFFKITMNIVKAFCNESHNYQKFADYIHQAKINAKMQKLSQIELICDLLIGYSYFKLGKYDKASSIYYNVLETATKNGLKLITYLDWYFVSLLKFDQNDIDVAYGIANNAAVQLEKDHSSGDFIFFLFRILLAKILTAKADKKSAELCLNDAILIQQRYDLKFEINSDLININL